MGKCDALILASLGRRLCCLPAIAATPCTWICLLSHWKEQCRTVVAREAQRVRHRSVRCLRQLVRHPVRHLAGWASLLCDKQLLPKASGRPTGPARSQKLQVRRCQPVVALATLRSVGYAFRAAER